MKTLNLGSAVRAGIVGTVAMTVLMYAAPYMGLPPMDLLAALGSALPLGVSPYLVGGAVHLAIGVTLAVLYAAVFERTLPGPWWLRGALFSLLPWLFAITLMAPTMAWFQATVHHAEARAAVNPCAASRPVNPCAVTSTPRVANPCAMPATMSGSRAWLPAAMSLMAHLAYGTVMASVYRRREDL